MPGLTIHNFQGKTIRAITDGSRRTWWSIKDILAAIDSPESPAAWWNRLDGDQKENMAFIGPQGRQYLRVISIQGLRRIVDAAPDKGPLMRLVEGALKEGRTAAGGLSENFKMLTPTQIGAALGGITPQTVNALLVRLGMQRPVMDFNRKRYLLTDVGRIAGIETAVKKENGEEVVNIMWKATVINLISAKAQAEQRKIEHA